jgi:hypothetical protein
MVEYRIHMKQVIVTSVTADEFTQGKAISKFKEGVVAGLGNSPAGRPYYTSDILVHRIMSAIARRSLRTKEDFAPLGLGSDARTASRRLAASLELKYSISIRRSNVDPVPYSQSDEFGYEFEHIEDSLPFFPANITRVMGTPGPGYTPLSVTVEDPVLISTRATVEILISRREPTMAPTTLLEKPVSTGLATWVLGSIIFVLLAIISVMASHSKYDFKKNWKKIFHRDVAPYEDLESPNSSHLAFRRKVGKRYQLTRNEIITNRRYRNLLENSPQDARFKFIFSGQVWQGIVDRVKNANKGFMNLMSSSKVAVCEASSQLDFQFWDRSTTKTQVFIYYNLGVHGEENLGSVALDLKAPILLLREYIYRNSEIVEKLNTKFQGENFLFFVVKENENYDGQTGDSAEDWLCMRDAEVATFASDFCPFKIDKKTKMGAMCCTIVADVRHPELKKIIRRDKYGDILLESIDDEDELWANDHNKKKKKREGKRVTPPISPAK